MARSLLYFLASLQGRLFLSLIIWVILSFHILNPLSLFIFRRCNISQCQFMLVADVYDYPVLSGTHDVYHLTLADGL